MKPLKYLMFSVDSLVQCVGYCYRQLIGAQPLGIRFTRTAVIRDSFWGQMISKS